MRQEPGAVGPAVQVAEIPQALDGQTDGGPARSSQVGQGVVREGAREFGPVRADCPGSSGQVPDHGHHPLLDPGQLADRAVRGQPVDEEAVAYAVKPMFDPPDGPRIDVVVLACTHFPLIREAIAAACPPGVMLIDTGAAVARQALRVAPATSAAPDGPAVAYVTGGVANQAAMAPAFARFGYDEVRVVDV